MDFVAGCIGGAAGCIASHPLDTVKVRMQTTCGHSHGLNTSSLRCFLNIIKHESYTGLYRGVTSPLCSIAAVNAVMFGTFGSVMRYIDKPEHLTSHFIAGGAAGLAISPILCPVELVKTKLQTQTANLSPPLCRLYKRQTYCGVLDCTKKIYWSCGVSGLSRGLLATVGREVPAIAIYFPVFEFLQQQYKAIYQTVDCPIVYLFIFGGISGCVSWGMTYPIDVIKTRIQADGTYSRLSKCYRYNYSSYISCYRQAIDQNGYPVLYRGIGSTLIRAFPNNAVTLATVSLVHTFYKKLTDQSDESYYTHITELTNQTSRIELPTHNNTIQTPATSDLTS